MAAIRATGAPVPQRPAQSCTSVVKKSVQPTQPHLMTAPPPSTLAIADPKISPIPEQSPRIPDAPHLHFDELVRMGAAICESDFVEVCKATSRFTGQPLAVKITRDVRSNASEREVIILDYLDAHDEHLNFICRRVFSDASEDRRRIVLGYAARGNLFDHSVKHGALSEKEACLLFKPLFKGMAHMHRLGVAHLDLCLENICIRADGGLTLIDFGYAGLSPSARKTQLSCTQAKDYTRAEDHILPDFSSDGFWCTYNIRFGRSPLVSPEAWFNIRPWNAFAHDVFAMGEVLCTVILGHPSHQEPTWDDPWYRFMATCGWLDRWKRNLSHELTHLIEGMMRPEAERLTMAQVADHAWFNVHG